jgi:hypothetical protein
VAELHRHDVPLALASWAPEQLNYDSIVPVGEDVRLDHNLVADGALDGIAAAVDLRPDRLDDGARRRGPDLFARFIQA